MDFHFEKEHKPLVAVDAGWQKNGYSVFEVLSEDGASVDTLLVHPLDDIENTVAEWLKS